MICIKSIIDNLDGKTLKEYNNLLILSMNKKRTLKTVISVASIVTGISFLYFYRRKLSSFLKKQYKENK
jgi:hypothetical protein